MKGGGNVPTFHVLLCTAGKPEINAMIASLKNELLEGDAITIIFDGPNAYENSKIDENLLKEFKCPVKIIKEETVLGFWGHGARNKYQGNLTPKTTYIMNADDDDTYIAGSFNILRQKCTDPSVLYIARLTYVNARNTLIPNEYVLKYGNISTQNGIIPFDLAAKGVWKEKYGGDFDYYTDIKNTGVKITFFDDVIYLKSGPNKQVGGSLETSTVCAIMLKEEPYVDEWIQYYIYGLGFNHIFIYDNSDDNSLKDLSNKYPGKVTIRHFPGKVKQIPAYNDFLVKNRTDPNKYTWCAFYDCDEFLVLKKHTNITDFLKEYCKEGGVCINWYLFGDSNLKEYINEPVTKRFTMRQTNVDRHVKTIVKCDDLNDISCLHGMNGFKTGKSKKDTNGKIVDGPFNVNGPNDVAVIHHYIIKTRVEHNIKKNRGRANTNNVKQLRTAESFNIQNHNEVKDESASVIYDRAKKEYESQLKGGSHSIKRYKNLLKSGGNIERTYVFIIPYRARVPHEIRKVQVKKCIDSISSCFIKHNKKFKIIVAEQNNDYPFNTALLKNIGFLEGEKKYNIPKVYLHMNADYYIDTLRDFPKELDEFDGNGVLDIYSIDKEDKNHYVGGCCCFGVESFMKVNGFPNNLFGWGGCDVAFRYRVNTLGIKYIRNALTNSGWILVGDDTERDTTLNNENVKKAKCDIMSNGLNTCKYNVDGFGEFNDESHNVYHLLLNFSYP